MPFTPLHMGPAIALKSIAGRYFSLMVFGFSQVAMDIEPLVRILRDDDILHGFTHTYVGAALVAIPSLLIGRPVCQYFLNSWKADSRSGFLNWLRGPEVISWPAAITGAFIGTYSHVVLDSVMHYDTRPLAPFSQANLLYGLLSIESLHAFCVLSAAAGGVVLIATFLLRRR